MSTSTITLTRADHGRRMTLEEFEHADGGEGCRWELARGVVVMVDVADLGHGRQVEEARDQLVVYRRVQGGKVVSIFGGGECKVLIDEFGSERHPDLAIYLAPPPEGVSGADVWRTWIPDIVIEVVSLSSVVRDYDEKPDEYLKAGVREYWIIDSHKGHLTVLRRTRNRWKQTLVSPPELYSTPLLRGLEFDVAAVFAAAE